MSTPARKNPAVLTIATLDLRLFATTSDRLTEIRHEAKKLEAALKPLEGQLIALFEAGAVVPPEFGVAVEEHGRRNISWKDQHGRLCERFHLDAAVEQNRVAESILPTITKELIVTVR